MSIIKKLIAGSVSIFAIAGLVIFILWWLNPPQEFVKNSQSLVKLKQGGYGVVHLDLTVVDTDRRTPALGGYEGDDKRSLNGTIWLPENSSAEHPLIIFSHGFGSHHQGCRHIAQYLARNGYVVAAVDFPLSNLNSPANGPQLVDVVNQPGDVSAVIDHLLALNTDSTSVLFQRIDPDKIGAMGLSLGGLTTALASFHPDLKDERIQTAVMLAPPLEAFSERFYASNPKVKSLIVSGTLDRVVPAIANA